MCNTSLSVGIIGIYTVRYSDSNDDLPSLPLFGKIAFYNVKKQLGLMGCKVLIKHIKLA